VGTIRHLTKRGADAFDRTMLKRITLMLQNFHPALRYHWGEMNTKKMGERGLHIMGAQQMGSKRPFVINCRKKKSTVTSIMKVGFQGESRKKIKIRDIQIMTVLLKRKNPGGSWGGIHCTA